MNIYPAIQASMGRWKYYLVKMSMRDLADSVKFSTEIEAGDRTLDEALQRVLNNSRVKKEITAYLSNSDDRFFSSIVVAALKGNPQWYPVSMEDDERFTILKNDPRLNNSFGILSFDGSHNYYALDGQHRLAAIRELVKHRRPDAPDDFDNEEVSVIVVVPTQTETDKEFLIRYRRLFGNLNRYAKPTDRVTNIIMDEDDVFAIITRRLISSHRFFSYSGKETESPRIKTIKGKNVSATDSFFTSLETLYEMNIKLLNSRYRRNNGWNEENKSSSAYRLIRPNDDKIDELYEELTLYWNALLEALPELENCPVKMREHSPDARKESNSQDSALFWPIGQEILADLARELMDRSHLLDNYKNLDLPSVVSVLKKLNHLTWDLHEPPWRNLILVSQDADEKSWRIRSEDRKKAVGIVKTILAWQIGLEELDSAGMKQLRYGEITDTIEVLGWSNMLIQKPNKVQQEEMWNIIEENVSR